MTQEELMQKVAQVAPEKYEFLLSSADEISSSPFKEELSSEIDGVFKQAAIAWDRVSQGAYDMSKGLALATAAHVGMSLAGDLVDASKRALFKTRNYKKMMALNPDLRERSANQVQSIFSTLHRFNPDFSADPVVAGSFVRQHVDLAGEGPGQVHMDSLKLLVDARKGLNESRRLQTPKLFEFPGKEDPEMAALQKEKLRGEIAKHRR